MLNYREDSAAPSLLAPLLAELEISSGLAIEVIFKGKTEETGILRSYLTKNGCFVPVLKINYGFCWTSSLLLLNSDNARQMPPFFLWVSCYSLAYKLGCELAENPGRPVRPAGLAVAV